MKRYGKKKRQFSIAAIYKYIGAFPQQSITILFREKKNNSGNTQRDSELGYCS